MHDTFQRSCQHWSEEGRDEMEKFYTLASVDYQYLAEAVDWKNWIEEQQEMVGKKNLKILDVACGSGKFPLALAKFSNVADARIFPLIIHFSTHPNSRFPKHEMYSRSPLLQMQNMRALFRVWFVGRVNLILFGLLGSIFLNQENR